MEQSDLFEADEILSIDGSGDSPASPLGEVSEAYSESIKSDDGNNDDYEFLFGENAKSDKNDKIKSVSEKEKRLERRLREVTGTYNDYETTEEEVHFSLDGLSEHYERRQAVESEILLLFSGLLTKEQFVVNPVPPQEVPQVNERPPEFDKSVGNMIKRLIRQTFRGRAPKGRFGVFGKNTAEPKKVNETEARLTTVTTLGRDSLSNLRDLNTLLSRERGPDFQELDGVPLYKHTRYGTIYIFQSNFVQTHIVPLCTMIVRGSVPKSDFDCDSITKEIVYLLYQLSQPPSEAWFKYWTEAQSHYMAFNDSKTVKLEERCSLELKQRIRLVWDYVNGMASLRESLLSGDVWTLIGEFRLKLEQYKREGYTSSAKRERLVELVRLRDSLASERDSLMAGMDSDDDHELAHGRLRKDLKTKEEKKRRIRELRNRIFDVSEEISKENEASATAERQTKVHMKTVRFLVAQLLVIPGDGISLLVLLQESGILPILKDETISMFETCKKGFIPNGDEIEVHAAYLSESQRASLWEYVRLVHAILVSVDIGSFLNMVHSSNSAKSRSFPQDLFLGANAADLLGSRVQEVNLGFEDESLYNLARLNPKLARLRLAGEKSGSGSFSIKNTPGSVRRKLDYDRLFRFPTLKHLKTPFELIYGVGGSNKYRTVSKETAQSLQFELHSLVGIDSEFEHCHWTGGAFVDGDLRPPDADAENSTGARVYYELGLMLLLCFGDLEREAEDSYRQHCDIDTLLDIHTWAVTYYRCLYTVETDRSLKENSYKPPEAFVLLALRSYVGTNNLKARVLCAHLWRLIRKHSMRKQSCLSAISALRCFYADLIFIHMLSGSQNVNVVNICKQALAAYFSQDIKAAIFWILRFFRPRSHDVELFIFALAGLHLLHKVVRNLGSVSFTIQVTKSHNVGYVDESDSSDCRSSEKLIFCKADSVFTSRNRNTADGDILYNGRVVYNCVSLLSCFRNNSAQVNDLLVTHLELVPLPILFDIKYFYLFREVIRERRVWQNSRWRWIGEFCSSVLESFFDRWLCNRGNRFMPLELLFSKSSPATIGAFRPCAKEHLTPIIVGYESCKILTELLKDQEASVFDVARKLKCHTGAYWDKDEDAALLRYYAQFSFLEDPISYIADLLGRSTENVSKRLKELNSSEVTQSAKPGSLETLKRCIKQLVGVFGNDAIIACSELSESLKDSLEMRNLGGPDAACEVLEPLSASGQLLDSAEFKSVLACFGISSDWQFPRDSTGIDSLLQVLENPDSYTGITVTERERDAQFSNRDTDYNRNIISSRDIAKLILDFYRIMDSVPEKGSCIMSVFEDAMRLLESAILIGHAESVCESLPTNPAALEKLSEILGMAKIATKFPTLVCDSMENGAVELDRLRVAISLCKLPRERLESIAEDRALCRDANEEVNTLSDSESLQGESTLDFQRTDPQIVFSSVKKRVGRKLSGKVPDTEKPPKSVKKPKSGNGEMFQSTICKKLAAGELKISAAEIMGLGSFRKWEESFEQLRSVAREMGCTEEFVDGVLWFEWNAELAARAIRESESAKSPPLNFEAFRRLESNVGLVRRLHEESLRLSAESRLDNSLDPIVREYFSYLEYFKGQTA